MKVIFLDRDGTLLAEPPDQQVDSLEKLELVPGVLRGLRMLLDHGYELVLVTNQDNLGTPAYPMKAYEQVQAKMLQLLAGEGIRFIAVFVCPHGPNDGCPCRKPKTGLVQEFLTQRTPDLEHSFVLGDRETDVQLAKNIGCKAIRLTADSQTAADFSSTSFLDAVKYILSTERTVRHNRKTNETTIGIEVRVDGTGKSFIRTGVGFFDHMLEQLSKHSAIDMTIDGRGDLHIDEHHTVEDVGLALGEALRLALGDKRGIGRYGFLLPMDESLAQVALDVSGRPFCSFKAKFEREKVGEFPTELVEDFFRGFSDGLRATLHISVEGRNDHHKIEAVFKAVGRSLRQAVAKDPRLASVLPSTKGIL
ncbi:MAG: bifunctional histidinol-phosphatase/imidazoleglycerol-phosphate dehydratase HisB [Bacteroidota bacterium]